MTNKKRFWLGIALVTSLVLAGVVVRALYKRVSAGRGGSLLALNEGPRERKPLEAAEVLYDGKLSKDWQDWGWGPHELGAGPAKVLFANYGGILLHHAEIQHVYGGLAFRFQAPVSWGEFLHVSLRQAGKPDNAFPLVAVTPRHVAPLPEGWREVFIEWSELNPERSPFDRVLIGSRLSVGGEWVLLDNLILTRPSDTGVTGAARDGKLRVLCDQGSQPISELIYGTGGEDWASGQSVQRIGGNPLSRANWDLGTWNVGADWYFENTGQSGTIFDALVNAAKARRPLAIVVPMLGWVAKDATSFGFPRSKFGAQRQHDPYKPEAGDGFRSDGGPLQPGDPSQTSVPAPPELIAKWVRKVTSQAGELGARSAAMYILDNEPSLWNVTHRDVHPEPLGYDELLDRTIKYATAIRDADPEALIAGPAEWGWTGYLYSAKDRDVGINAQPDRRAHGGVPLVAWYLKKLAEHEKVTGKRLLDVLDLHFYPAAQGVWGSNAGTDAMTSELRLRSTRALWDASYLDESWIKEAVRLIPRMKDWVRENYPGRKLAIGEWSFGAEAHISGGLATAEALGRFGQQGLYAAFHWGGLPENTPAYWAFRAFRNFDGSGGRFQDVALPVTEMEKVSLFASRDAAGEHIVLVLINRDTTTKQVRAEVALQGCGRVASSRLFSYAAGSKALVEGPSDVTEAGVSVTLEPLSLGVLDLRLKKLPAP